MQVGELEEATGRARCALLEAEGELKLATQLHDTSYEALESASGIHMVRWQTVCKQFRVNKGAYLGHGYTSDICKKICTLEVCVPLTNCLLEEFRPQLQVLKRLRKKLKSSRHIPELFREVKDRYEAAKMELDNNNSFIARRKLRDSFLQRFQKWSHVYRLLAGSVNFRDTPRLLDLLELRCASFSGFFASAFPETPPTPKQYFAVTFGPRFAGMHGFHGHADEQPSESHHADVALSYARFCHCKSVETSMLAYFRQLHVRNNVKALLGTGPQDP